MNLRARSLILIAVGGAVAATQLPTSPIGLLLRTLITLPLVLLLPGYALTKTLFSGHHLGVDNRLNLIVGLSLAVSVLTGLLLSFLSIRLTTTAWSLALAVVTLLILLTLRQRGSGVPDIRPVLPGIAVGLRSVLLFTAAIGICIVSLMIARSGAVQHMTPEVTQLWILPSQEMNQDLVHVGITNDTEAPMSRFRLVVTADAEVIQEWPLIELEGDQTWENPVTLQGDYRLSAEVTATLYLADNPSEPYRHVTLYRGQ